MGLPSLAMGVFPLLSPHRTTRLIGVASTDETRNVVRLVGLRELIVAGIFLRHRTPGSLRGFVAEDAIDLPVCAWVLLSRRAARDDRFRRACLAYGMLMIVDLYTAVTRNTGATSTRSASARLPSV